MEMEFKLQDIRFHQKDGFVRAVFLERYYFDIKDLELQKIGSFRVEDGALVFKTGKNLENKFSLMLAKGFEHLYNSLNGRKTIYIHKNSGIPLMGTSYFGIVDRNTNLIEIRPNTGCNLNCIYCSVNEGLDAKKMVDYVVEKDYLVQELAKVIGEKQDDDIEIHINPQGEPMLYAPLAGLVSDISSISQVKRISIDTNATLLTEDKVDELVKAGMTQFNLSIDSLDKEKASRISGCNYSTESIKKICKIIAERSSLLIAPLWMQGVNDEDMKELVAFAKETGAKVGIQNYLNYKHGKNPLKAITMDEFYSKLAEMEQKYGIKLVFGAEDFGVHPTKKLAMPFKKGDVVNADIACQGRMREEVLGIFGPRVIEIKEYKGSKKKTKVKIVRSKHNIFHGIAVS